MWRLIYTSSPRGLVSGQSGFCTVARSADLREAVAQRLEQISSYHYLEMPAGGKPGRNPTISAYRILDIRGTKFYALTRIQPSGLDFTARTNHLAQHLVFQAEELTQLPSPAAILRDWDGWLPSWQGEPRLMDRLTFANFGQLPPPSWPARSWQELTGDAGRAAGLLEAECARGCYLLCPAGGEHKLLDLFCETLQLPNWTGKYPLRAWQYTFTTFLQGEDGPADFHWRGCQEGTPAHAQAIRRSASLFPLNSVRVPANPLAKFAREGPKIAAPSPGAAGQPLTLRKERTAPIAPRVSPDWRGARSTSQPEQVSLLSRLNQPAVKTIGIAAVLLVAVLTVRFWIGRQRAHREAANPGVVQAGTNGTSIAEKLSSAPLQTSDRSNQSGVKTNVTASSESSPPLKPTQRLEAFFGTEGAVFLVTAQRLNESIPLRNVQPLETLLADFEKRDLTPKDLEVEFNVNTWDFATHFPMQFAPFQDNQHQLSGKGRSMLYGETTVVFDYLRAAEEPIRVRATVEQGEPTAFSLVFRPANGARKSFPPFRLLVVSEVNAPPAFELNAACLRASPRRFPEDFEPPLSTRIQQQFRANKTATWRLRPYVVPKGGRRGRYLYETWKADERAVAEREPMDFSAIKTNLAQKLAGFTHQLSELEQRAGALTNIAQNPDFSLPLGAFLELTNAPELFSFPIFTNHLYTNASPATRKPASASAEAYLRYLEQIKEKSHTNCSWLEPWPSPRGQSEEIVTARLNSFYNLLRANVSSRAPDFTVSGPTTNYFLAVWKKLKAGQDQEQLQRNRREKLQEMKAVEERLAELDARKISLCFEAAPERWLEVIRFSNTSP